MNICFDSKVTSLENTTRGLLLINLFFEYFLLWKYGILVALQTSVLAFFTINTLKWRNLSVQLYITATEVHKKPLSISD